jgi:hypothetical protein
MHTPGTSISVRRARLVTMLAAAAAGIILVSIGLPLPSPLFCVITKHFR